MGRNPCCSKEGLNRGAWSPLEDKALTAYIRAHGEGKWRNLPKRAGLKRCGKSCRLRWVNYLRPDIKRGNISIDEEELIIRLHKLLGNRWSLIAGRLPGRTDNEIKNYWNTTLSKKANTKSSPGESKQVSSTKSNPGNLEKEPLARKELPNAPQATKVIRTKPSRCSRILVSLQSPSVIAESCPNPSTATDQPRDSFMNYPQNSSDKSSVHIATIDEQYQYQKDSDFMNFDCNELPSTGDAVLCSAYNKDLEIADNETSLAVNDLQFNDWVENTDLLDDDTTLDVDSLSFLLESEEWLLL